MADGHISVIPQSDAYPLSSIAKLYVALVDAIKGYNTMFEKAEPELISSLTPFSALHQRHATELSAILHDNGVMPAEDGSIMGMVHETVVSIRAMFGDLDLDALPAVIDGEDALVAVYQDTLDDIAATRDVQLNGNTSPLAERLKSHMFELQSAISLARTHIQHTS